MREFETELRKFHQSYKEALVKNQRDPSWADVFLGKLLHEVKKAYASSYPFGIYHEKLPEYEKFGTECVEPLIIWKDSHFYGKENAQKICQQLAQGGNVIFFANHQIEPDPQVLLLYFEKEFPLIAKRLIFVAGHRVTTDPMSVPFSKGCSLLCIYSKNYIDHPPEKKGEKVQHNQKAMRKLAELLQEGGKCIYVAPSGGRDRPDANGKIVPAPFDPKSIEMFRFIAEKVNEHPTHFYPLALSTHALFPPPKMISKELGEQRLAYAAPIGIHVGEEIDMSQLSHDKTKDRKLQRQNNSEIIWKKVAALYENFNWR